MSMSYFDRQYVAEDETSVPRPKTEVRDVRQVRSSGSQCSKGPVGNQGFRNYLEIFRKRQPEMSKSESFREARAKYNSLSKDSQAKYERLSKRRSRPVAKRVTEPVDMGYNHGHRWERLPRNKYTNDVGFINYKKIYMCKNPNLSKRDATRYAMSLYNELSESAKEKYKNLGTSFACPGACPKPCPKACPKPCPPCPKNRRACPPKEKQCPPKPKKCCPPVPSCCPQPPPPFCPPGGCPQPPKGPCPKKCGGPPKCCARPKCCGAPKKCAPKCKPKKKACCPR